MAVEVVFLDLGDTLVRRTPGVQRASWLPGALATLTDLHTRGLRLGVISDTDTLTREQLFDSLPVDFPRSRFEESLLILSSEVGVEKPDLKIFHEALAAAAVPDDRCLFCTENLAHTLAAQQVGMLTARLQKPPNGDLSELVASLQQVGLL